MRVMGKIISVYQSVELLDWSNFVVDGLDIVYTFIVQHIVFF